MKVIYDEYYQTENLFGHAYPELIEFFESYPKKEKLLDLGCGQGRDAIPLAELGYGVTGVEISKVGLDQMMKVAKSRQLNLEGIVEDIYKYDGFEKFDFVLLDSMFHFTKKDRIKETDLIKRIIDKSKIEALIVFCIQDTGNKVKILKEIIDSKERIFESDFVHEFFDEETDHSSKTKYKIIAVKV